MATTGQVKGTSGTGAEPRYRPIREYGVIGDCRTAALIGPDGSIDWCCLPHFDSPALFLRILDADKGGFFRIHPEAPANSEMTYMPDTNILDTTFVTGDGRLRVVDYMPIRKREQKVPLLKRVEALLTHAPHGLTAGLERELGNDVAAAHRINRMVSCLEGTITAELGVKATFDFARRAPTIERVAVNLDTAAAIISGGQRYLVLLVRRKRTIALPDDREPVRLGGDDETVTLRLPMSAGQSFVAVVNYARTETEARAVLAGLTDHDFDRDLTETRSYWRDWSASCAYDGPYQKAVMRSALALKLCTFEPTGAIVAAPTTSLPESIGSVRNWDYRYTWLRDSTFTLGALERLGYYGEAHDYFHFIHDLQIKCGSDIRIMYGIRGESDGQLAEHDLDHLEGYKGSQPVRLGNGAATQRQLDIYGELMDSAYSYLCHEGFIPKHERRAQMRDLRDLCCIVADYVADHWQDNDRGIWEVRGDPRAFVYSRAMCWVALDRAVKMAHRHEHHHHVPRWAMSRDEIHADVIRHGYSDAFDSFMQSYGSDTFDAANLRLPLAEFLPWDDQRIADTVNATKRALNAPRAMLYRYRAVSGDEQGGGSMTGNSSVDGLPGTEGAFIACAFWLIDDLCYLGNVEEARQRFEQILGLAGPLGLFAEELDPNTGEQLGNYPQAFTHIGLITSAVTLQEAQEGTLHVRRKRVPLA